MLARIVTSLFILFAWTALAPPPPSTAGAAAARLGEPLTLHWGETAWLDDAHLEIVFASIFSDGRCPQTIECAETFPVQVALKVRAEGARNATRIGLSAHTAADGAVIETAPGAVLADTYGGWQISLLAVTPYPAAHRQIMAEDYAVTLLVRSAEDSGPPRLGAPFTVAAGQETPVDDAPLRLAVRRIEDSRCPADLDCGSRSGVEVLLDLWTDAGNEATVSLSGRTDTAGRVLPATQEVSPRAAALGYTVELVRVAPYPESALRLRQGDYRITLRVTESSSAFGQSTQPGSSRPAIQPDEILRIGLAESAQTADGRLRLSFDAVEDDSRCPAHQFCVWQGVVNVRLTAQAADREARTFVLGGVSDQEGVILGPLVEATGPTEWRYADYQIYLMSVTPYPEAVVPDAVAAGYEVALWISQVDEAGSAPAQ